MFRSVKLFPYSVGFVEMLLKVEKSRDYFPEQVERIKAWIFVLIKESQG